MIGREISPITGLSVDQVLERYPSEIQNLIEGIRRQKQEGIRSYPSKSLIDQSALMNQTFRALLTDKIASLVDENLTGRSDMCEQYALLMHKALSHLGHLSKAVTGTCIYYTSDGSEQFRWRHSWVRIGSEVVDGNVDSVAENPLVPKSVCVKPYWGPITNVPSDRKLRVNHGEVIPVDSDVDEIWWPELKVWLDEKGSNLFK